MMELICTGTDIRCLRPFTVTTGMVGAPVTFTFDSAWRDITGRTAVFSAGEKEYEAALTDSVAAIPWEVLQQAGERLTIGVYGQDAAGNTWPAPTPMCDCGVVQPGARSAVPSARPTPALTAQILAAATQARSDAGAALAMAESLRTAAEEASASAAAASRAADAARSAANSVGYVSFSVTEGGHVVIENAQRLGTASFTLNQNGHLEVDL